MTDSEDLLRGLRQTFQAEATEHLQALNTALLSLEAHPEESRCQELIQQAFRAAHSLKGAARMVSLDAIESLAHAMENLLARARDAHLQLRPEAYDVLYDVLDAMEQLVGGGSVAVGPLISRLADTDAADQCTPGAPAAEPGAGADASEILPTVPTDAPHVEKIEPEPPPPDDPAAGLPAISYEETIRVTITKLDNLMAQVGELLVSRMNAEQRAAEMQAIREKVATWPKIWREIRPLLPQVNGDRGQQLEDTLARCQDAFESIAQGVSHLDERLRQDTLRLGIIASQIQDDVRHVRMVPFETLTPGLQRAVRDAARLEGKQVTFHVSGGDVELDKKVLETLKDPFLHLVRNAVSHGIEAPAERRRFGKPAEGNVTLSLQQHGAEVHISVSDDGAGFDLAALRQAGTELNGQNLNDRATQQDILELAFVPGLTTSPEVTALSGRGVGLDVVRQRLEALQGRIEVDSVPGRGATLHLVVPITLAISRGLLVQVDSERYVLPLLSVVKIVEPRPIFTVGGHTMITVDGSTLPLLSLANLLERPAAPDGSRDGPNGLAIIMAVAEQRLALLVDDVLTEQELAVKPLGKPLRHVHNVAGAALLGDGKPVVVLNAADLVRAAKGTYRHAVIHKLEPPPEKVAARILVIDDSITTRTLEKTILETAGYEVVTATDGDEALQRLKQQRVDLVVSDIQMPNMDGFAFTRHLRASADYKDLPIILVTSMDSAQDRERGMVAGANAYIVKRGFDQAELLKSVQQLIFIEEG